MRTSLLFFLSLAFIACGGPAAAEVETGGRPNARIRPPDGMVLVPGGSFLMGSDAGHDDEAPVHELNVPAFFLDRHEVSNAAFAKFAAETDHVTDAERSGGAWCYVEGAKGFELIAGADWRHPRGPGSSVEGAGEHPVVCVSWRDAAAYARWAGKRLPSEAEWEYAARAGNRGHLVADTDGKRGEDEVAANVWEGTWPEENRLTDGFFYTSPAGSYPANPWGVSDMLGNVWEWCADWYAADAYARSVEGRPATIGSGTKRVARGGSWFCSANYCSAYSTHFRGASPPGRGFNNVGFRCAADVTGKEERR